MPILASDIKLLASKVMDDVPEGGGGPTATAIADGASNDIFQDISDVDRALGHASLRKLHVGVGTVDTDTYLGCNIIVAEPPADPNVSVTLFSTGETFDTRTNAKNRLESYLTAGTRYSGYLLGDHIAGQASLIVLQPDDMIDLPTVGQTLVVRKRSGFTDEVTQFVRVKQASGQLRSFIDASGTPFKKFMVRLDLTEPLRSDFPGFDPVKGEPSSTEYANKTLLRESVVVDAARYYGVSRLDQPVSVGDLTVKASSLFTQLVPSAQTETPLADVRSNNTATALQSTGQVVRQTINAVFTPTQSLFIGAAITPGTLTVTRNGITLTEQGGVLLSSGQAVGTVDCANGMLSLTSSPFGAGAGPHDVSYTSAAASTGVNQSVGLVVTAINRSLNYVRTLNPVPTRGSLTVSYMALGKWVVLKDDGSGALRGSSTAIGAGQINFTTGTVVATLGALPDVGSAIIYQWADSLAGRSAGEFQMDSPSKLYIPINSDGQLDVAPGSKSIEWGSLAIEWNDGQAKRVVDYNGKLHIGTAAGAEVGTVDYAQGVIRLSPQALPARGTSLAVSTTARVRSEQTRPVSVNGSQATFNLGQTNVVPWSVDIRLTGVLRYRWRSGSPKTWSEKSLCISDDGSGNLKLWLGAPDRFIGASIVVGTVNYTTGACTIDTVNAITRAVAKVLTAFDSIERPDSGWMGY